METIDAEVGRILREQSDRSYKTLETQRGQLEKLADALLAKEELDEVEIEAILGKSVHASQNGHARGKSAADLAAAPS
jgi:ATP-dependent Zn protease